MSIILLNKPFNVLTRFMSDDGRPTLRNFLNAPGFHPAGRLDHDSEGLLLLTDEGALQARLSHPRWKVAKVYYAQVEGVPSETALRLLRNGVQLNDGPTLPALAAIISEPEGLWPRDPPIRYRAKIPTTWIQLTLKEGRNRQVRRMTAAVGHPTLRLIRWAVGPWTLAGLTPGEHRFATPAEIRELSQLNSPGVLRMRPDKVRRVASRVRGPARS